MPSIPLVTELGAKADAFQALLNSSKIPSSIEKSLLPMAMPNEMFTLADSRIFVRSRPVIPFDQQPMGDVGIVHKIDGYKDAVLMAPKVSVSGQCSIETSRIVLDGIFVGSEDSTEYIYESSCSPLLALSVGGASTCVLCYGQTGSGKTFTTSGLMKLFAADIGPYLDTHSISMAVVEVQSGVNVDLLTSTPVQVVEDGSGEIQLLGASEYPIENSRHMLELIASAAAARSTKATGRNEQSSRSHMIVRVRFVPKATTWAKPGFLFVADLAGSENTADSATHDKTRQMEAKFINSSLMTLKDCIRARAMCGSSDKHLHIPFRQSPLTLILRDCFELAVRRPTKTVVIACTSPLLRDARHTIGTLRYASLLAVAPPPVVVALSKDDPNGWDRPTALDFLVKASRGRIVKPELVLPEGEGRALVHIPEAEFITRVITTHTNISEKSAKLVYTEVWKAVVDARTKTRQALKGGPSKAVNKAPTAGEAAPVSSRPAVVAQQGVRRPGNVSPVPVEAVRRPVVVASLDQENVIRKNLPAPGSANWRSERESGWVVE
jgi:kinesin family member 2/24